MPLVPLQDLVAAVTQPNALANILALATGYGLQTTAWQPLGMARTILSTIAQVVSSASQVVNAIAQGGFLTYSATMPANGSPYADSQGFLTTWLDLVSTQVYNVSRIQATFALGDAPITNNNAGAYSFAAGAFHMTNPSNGATYTNRLAFTLPGGGATNLAPMIADVAGAASSVGTGTVLGLQTPQPGLVVNAIGTSGTVAWVGENAETNAALVVRCQAKLGALSPAGSPQAYYFVATTIPQGTPSSATPPYAVAQSVNRVGVMLNVNAGVTYVSIANVSGPSNSGDVAVVNAAIQALAVPNASTVIVQACTQATINISATAYAPAASALTQAQVQAALSAAIAVYYGNTPVGGLSTSVPNQMPRDALISVMSLALAALTPGYAQRTSVAMPAPAADTTMLSTDVPVGTVTVTLVLT
jgi:baseplate J-like protein